MTVWGVGVSAMKSGEGLFSGSTESKGGAAETDPGASTPRRGMQTGGRQRRLRCASATLCGEGEGVRSSLSRVRRADGRDSAELGQD